MTATHAGAISQEETPKVSLNFILRYWLADLGVYITVMLVAVMTLAIRVEQLFPTHKTTYLSYILFFGALFAMLSNPICGQLCDRTRSRWGRRKPWIIGGMLVSIFALICMALTTSLWGLMLFMCLLQIGINSSLSAVVAVVPDRIPFSQRGLVSALHGMSANLAIMMGALIVYITGTQPLVMFVGPGILGMIGVLIFVCRYPEPEVKDLPTPKPFSLLALIKSFWFNPRKHPDFAWTLAGRFFLYISNSTLGAYEVYYLTDVLKFDIAHVSGPMALASTVTGGCIVVAAMISGLVSDRIHRRKPFVLLAGLIYAAGFLILVMYHSFGSFMTAIVVTSLGVGVYAAVDQAMAVDVLPDSKTDAAKNMGIFNIANAAPQSLAPAMAPLFLNIGGGNNYTMLFSAAAVIAVIGALLILPVKGVK